MRRNLKVCKLDYHFQKHVEGKDKDDRRPEKIKIRESIQWKEHQKVVCKKDYIEAAQKNIFYSQRIYIHSDKDKVSVNFQKDNMEITYELITNIYPSYSEREEYDNLLTTCVVNFGEENEKISTCFYKTKVDETLEWLNFILTVFKSENSIVNVSRSIQLCGVRFTDIETRNLGEEIERLYHEYLVVPQRSKRLCEKAFLLEILLLQIQNNNDDLSKLLMEICDKWFKSYSTKRKFFICEDDERLLNEKMTTNFEFKHILLGNNLKLFKELFSINENEHIVDKEIVDKIL